MPESLQAEEFKQHSSCPSPSTALVWDTLAQTNLPQRKKKFFRLNGNISNTDDSRSLAGANHWEAINQRNRITPKIKKKVLAVKKLGIAIQFFPEDGSNESMEKVICRLWFIKEKIYPEYATKEWHDLRVPDTPQLCYCMVWCDKARDRERVINVSYAAWRGPFWLRQTVFTKNKQGPALHPKWNKLNLWEAFCQNRKRVFIRWSSKLFTTMAES